MEVDNYQEFTPDVEVASWQSVPKPIWNVDRKMFFLVPEPSQLPLHAKAEAKASLFIERYNMILQRIKRSPLFVSSREGFQITTVDSLLGSSGKKLLFGMLTQLKEGKFYLEDPKGNVLLDLSKTQYSSGLFCEGIFVLAEGEYKDSENIFYVELLGLPPAESRDNSKQYLQSLDFFMPAKAKSTTSKYSMFKFAEEQTAKAVPVDAEFVMVSDVHLDKPKVLDKLRIMLAEFALDPPTALFFMGNFTSQQGSLEDTIVRLKLGFEKLTDMLLSFPSLLKKSQMIFVPGPGDPGNLSINLLPKHPLPTTFVEYLQEKIPQVQFGSNPCRVRYYGHDLVLFRDDLVNKMRRHCVLQPQFDAETPDLTQHLVKTLLDQAHLCPLPVSIQPVYWNYDQCLSLFPLPDTLILADKFEQYEHNYEGCLSVNPGSFAVDYSFVTYRPSSKESGFSRVED